MDEKLKSISCFDIWVIITIIFFSIGNIPTPNNSASVAETMTLIIGILYIFGVIVFLIFCSRLKKYRYLLIYENCKKVTSSLKNALIILVGIGFSLMLYTQLDFMKSIIVYTSIAVILSYRHIDSEEKI